MRKLTGLAAIALLMVASVSVQAGYLFSENFDAGLGSAWENGRDASHLTAPAPGNKPEPACSGGSISSNTCEDGVGRLLDAGGGNLVYYSENWAFGSCRGMVGLRGTTAYNRADGPFAITKHFIIAAAPESGEANGAGAGLFGPWHRNQGTAGWGGSQDGEGTHAAACTASPATPGDLESDLELGTHHWPGWKQTWVDGVRTAMNCQGTDCPQLQNPGYRDVQLPASGPPHAQGANDNLADQEGTGSWWTRGELGTTSGGVLQYAESFDPATGVANGGAGWITAKDQSGTDLDTRNAGHGTAATVYLGWGGFKNFAMSEVYVGDASNDVPVELSG